MHIGCCITDSANEKNAEYLIISLINNQFTKNIQYTHTCKKYVNMFYLRTFRMGNIHFYQSE